jgi:uncharacterized protein (AIM24 family)
MDIDLFKRERTQMKTLAASSLAVFLLAGSASGQSINWTNPAGGLWNVPGNWAGGNVPSTISESAVFNLGASYSAALNISIADIDSLHMLDSMSTLNLNSGTSIGVNGGVVNDGLIVINPTNGGFSTTLNLRTPSSITGSGTLTLNGIGTRSILTSSVTTTNGVNHTINGFGRISGDFVNNGVVRSNASAATLDIRDAAWTNNNLMEVTNSSIMDLVSLTITQNASGIIQVADGQLNLLNTSIANGTLTSSGSIPGSKWSITSGTSIFDTVELGGEGHINSGAALDIFNSINNDGVLRLNPTNGGFSTNIEAQNNTFFNGTGSLVLGGIGNRAILRTIDPSVSITNTASHSIQGFGTIQAPIINNGQVIADMAGQTLLLNSNTKTNNSIFQVSNGAIMDVFSITIDQTGGGQISLDNGSLTLSTATILGGHITAGAGTATLTSGNSSFDNVTSSAPITMNSGTTLTVTNGFVNNATLFVNPTNGGFATNLIFADSSTLSGSGDTVLGGTSTRSRINTEVGQTMTVASNHTIRGFGQINASMINNGTINADFAGQSIQFRDQTKINNCLITAQSGATLDLNTVEIQQSPAGEIDVADGSLILTSSTIRGGTINADTGLVTIVSGTNRLDSSTLNAPLNMNSGAILILENGFEGNDTLTVNPTNGGFSTTVSVQDSMTFNGTGDMHLAGTTTRGQLNTEVDQTVTINPDYTVHGIGTINASLINNGTIDADTAGGTLDLRGSDKTNNALISIQPGATLSVLGLTLNQSPTGVILNNDGLLDLASTSIIGGTIDALFTGSTRISANTTLQDLDNLSPININSSVQLNVEGTVTNHNSINVNPTLGGFATSLNSNTPAMIDGNGEVVLHSTFTRSQITGAGITFGPNQTLRGLGLINAPITIEGTIAPGFSTGEMEANQPITLTNTSTYEVEVSNIGVNDTIDSASTFHADGVLDLSLIDGFNPSTAWVAVIVTADAGVTGSFDTIIAPPAPLDPRLSFKVGYFDNEIRVGAVCDTDFDFSGSLNFLDVSMFLALYGDMDPLVDLNSDGSFNFLDISLFLSSYGESCP